MDRKIASQAASAYHHETRRGSDRDFLDDTGFVAPEDIPRFITAHHAGDQVVQDEASLEPVVSPPASTQQTVRSDHKPDDEVNPHEAWGLLDESDMPPHAVAYFAEKNKK